MSTGNDTPPVTVGGPTVRRADVAVIGANLCGIGAAVAAARGGADVLVIEPSDCIGGHTTSGVNTAETEHMETWTIGGIAHEFFNHIGREYGRDHPLFFFESKVALRVAWRMLNEAGVNVLTGLAVTRAEKSGGFIRRVALSDGSMVEARVFIDASYEGDLMAKAGVSYTFGRESRQEYGESLAGLRLDDRQIEASPYDKSGAFLPGISGHVDGCDEGEGDRKVMCCNFRPIVTRDRDAGVPFDQPPGYEPDDFRLLADLFAQQRKRRSKPLTLSNILGLYPRVNRKMEVNNNQASIISMSPLGQQFDYADGDESSRRRVVDLHRSWAKGLLFFLTHDACVPAGIREAMGQLGYARDEFVDHSHFPPSMYVREARRMRGRYVMTQEDVAGSEASRQKPDSIATGSHFIDSHHVQRVAVDDTHCVNEGRIWEQGLAYEIPYRSLLPNPEEATNLLVPGSASFSHVAFCTYRLEATWMTAGHAAGVAACIAMDGDAELGAIDVTQLQTLLRAQGQAISLYQVRPTPDAWYDRMVAAEDWRWIQESAGSDLPHGFING